MDVSSNDQRRIQLDQVGLADENLLRLLDKGLDLLLCEVDCLPLTIRFRRLVQKLFWEPKLTIFHSFWKNYCRLS